MKLIDTHAHLYATEFDDDATEMLQRAKTNKLSHILLPNIDVPSIAALSTLCERSDKELKLLPMMGLHPCYVKADWEKQLSIIKETLDKNQPAFIAVGEIGLDYYWDTAFKTQQQEAFRTQLDWAIEKKLPVAIHCREAYDDVISILKDKCANSQLTGVLHCFGGDIAQAKILINLGFYLGIGGVVTYKKAGLAELLTDIDLKHLLLETDAPYLPPVPHRGKRNESSFISHVAAKIAEVKQISIEEVAAITTANASQLFKLT